MIEARVRRARLRLRPPAGRRRARPRRSTSACTAAKEHGMDVCLVAPASSWTARLAGPPAAPHRHRRPPRGGRRRRLLEPERPDPPRRLLLLASSAALERASAPRPARCCSTCSTPLLCPVSSALQLIRQRVDRARRPLRRAASMGPTRRSTTACASSGRRRVHLEPTVRARGARGRRRRARRRQRRTPDVCAVKHAGLSFQQWAPEVV